MRSKCPGVPHRGGERPREIRCPPGLATGPPHYTEAGSLPRALRIVDYCAVAAVNPFASFRVMIPWVPAALLKLPVTSRFPDESKAASLTS